MIRFRDEVVAQHATDHVDLLFNNAGIGGGASFVTGDRPNGTARSACAGAASTTARGRSSPARRERRRLPDQHEQRERLLGLPRPGIPHTAYSTAKFAVKGFSEALVTDFRVNAPHVKVAVVMPGHIGTDIVTNTWRVHGGAAPESMTSEQLAETRASLERQGIPLDGVTDVQLRAGLKIMGDGFRDNAPLTAADAATIILDGVRADSWRILVGDDAHALDEAVRTTRRWPTTGASACRPSPGAPANSSRPAEAARSGVNGPRTRADGSGGGDPVAVEAERDAHRQMDRWRPGRR